MKILIPILICMCFNMASHAQNINGWDILNDRVAWSFSNIDFVNSNIAWSSGPAGLFRTEDSGETWVRINPLDSLEFIDIDFQDTQKGWAASTYNIYRTENGGQTWLKRYELPDDYELLHMTVVNDSVIYINGVKATFGNGNGWIIKSIDGGDSWHNITPASPLKIFTIHFFDAEKGFMVAYSDSQRVLTTFNGGSSWEEKTIDPLYRFSEVQALNDTTIFFGAKFGDEQFLFCKTSDFFETLSVLHEYEDYLPSYHALDENTIFAIMSDRIMKSLDGGYSWEFKHKILNIGYSGYINMHFSTRDSGFFATPEGRFYKTIDGGESWTLISFSASLKDVFFIDNEVGFAFSTGGGGCSHCDIQSDIYMTANGGETWNLQLRTGNRHHALFFIDEQTGFYTEKAEPNGEGRILKSTDRGQTWAAVYQGQISPDPAVTNVDPLDIAFMDEETGWAVGGGSWSDSSGATILSTSDGGESWDLIWCFPDTDDQFNNWFNDIHVGHSMAWAVGEFGLMVKYAEQTGWQKMPSVTDLPLNDVYFSDEQHGWITGGYMNDQDARSVVLKTNNGGDSWTETDIFPYLAYDIYFADSLNGLAIGKDTTTYLTFFRGSLNYGVILHTIDGGRTWQPLVEGLSGPLKSLYEKNDVIWAVGDNGLVLRTDNWVTWTNPNTGKVYPSKYHLAQNYPNPFNPSTTIPFSIPKTAHVSIEIYNTIGQKVSTLVDKQINAGNHEIVFNAKNLSSGVYYYKITAGDYQQVKKMVLLK